MTVQYRHAYFWGIVFVVVVMSQTMVAQARSFGTNDYIGQALVGKEWVVPVQVPYEAPPKGQNLSAESVPQNTKPLTPEEVQRAEALLPLLEGPQEFWAMGEFVHLGEPVVPVLAKGLTMPGPRIRYNTIETI